MNVGPLSPVIRTCPTKPAPVDEVLWKSDVANLGSERLSTDKRLSSSRAFPGLFIPNVWRIIIG
jgi:hypothetical protein